jgi:hypothetical protein
MRNASTTVPKNKIGTFLAKVVIFGDNRIIQDGNRVGV